MKHLTPTHLYQYYFTKVSENKINYIDRYFKNIIIN